MQVCAEVALRLARERVMSKPQMHRIYLHKVEARLSSNGIGIDGDVILHSPFDLKVNGDVVSFDEFLLEMQPWPGQEIVHDRFHQGFGIKALDPVMLDMALNFDNYDHVYVPHRHDGRHIHLNNNSGSIVMEFSALERTFSISGGAGSHVYT